MFALPMTEHLDALRQYSADQVPRALAALVSALEIFFDGKLSTDAAVVVIALECLASRTKRCRYGHALIQGITRRSRSTVLVKVVTLHRLHPEQEVYGSRFGSGIHQTRARTR